MVSINDTISRALSTIDRYKALDQLKIAVADGEYAHHQKNFSRLLVWKTCLITDSLRVQDWDAKLAATRVVYHKLAQTNEMQVPWWTLENVSIYYRAKKTASLSRNSSVSRASSVRRLVKTNLARVSVEDPLSEKNVRAHSRSSTPEPYAHSEADSELLQTIIMDVERLFPGDPFFHSSTLASLDAKRQLIEILYVWAKCHPQVGYKQGIHEVLGVIYMNLFRESVDILPTNTYSSDDTRILALYDRHYLAHDLFTILGRFLVASRVTLRFYEGEEVLWRAIEDFNANLMKVDQIIHYNLVLKLKVELQLWIIRYLRLLLLRELNDVDVTSALWDRLVVADAPISDIIGFMVVVLLIHIKSDLITCDFSDGLSLLLHYPVPEQPYVFVDSLFKDAMKLYERRDNDLKLYEYGLRLNQKYNPNLRISMSFNGTTISAKSSSESSRAVSPVRQNGAQTRAETMAFEKTRMEMRLKKKAQQMLGK